jgi:hypothetical protein
VLKPSSTAQKAEATKYLRMAQKKNFMVGDALKNDTR